MKAKVIETERFAAAVLPSGEVEWASGAAALRLKLAAAGIEPEEWRPEGKEGLKAAVLASLGSADVPGALLAFCEAYSAAGRPDGAYACMTETGFAGGRSFRPGGDFDLNRPMDFSSRARTDVVRSLAKILVSSGKWKKVLGVVRGAMKGRDPFDLIKDFAAGENASWDEKDAEDALRAALANPVLNGP